jgi:hypothetical protein
MTIRPDRPPFGSPLRIGLPYHGRVINGELTLPNDDVIDYPDPSGGETVLVRHPLADAPTPTADDTARGYQWLDYALLSGDRRDIGGQSLADAVPNTADAVWLYCDEAHAWVVYFEFTTSGIEQTLTVKLQAPFGLIADAPPTMTPRTLGTYTWTPKRYNGSDQSSTEAEYPRNLRTTHSQTGAVTAVNIGATPDSGINPWITTAIYEFQPAQVIIGYHDVVKITLSGNGSLVAGSVGNGISVAFEHLATAPDMHYYAGAGDSDYACPENPSGIPAFPQRTDGEEYHHIYYCVKPDGTITHLEKTFIHSITWVYENVSCDPLTYDSVTETVENEWTWSFGGVTYESAGPLIPFDEYGALPGVLTIESRDASTATVVTMTGETLDVTGYTYLPRQQNLTWNPATGEIVFGDDESPGCFV